MDPNKEDEPFTPETLDRCAKRAEQFRFDCLFDIDDAGADPFAVEHYLTALAQLELAHRHFKLAKLCQSRGIAGR